jgi:hypothetical protein
VKAIRQIATILLAAILLLAALPSLVPAQAQSAEDVIHEKPIRLHHLAGRVVDRKGIAIPYSAIEMRDAKDHHMLATTFADANGNFSFADRKHGEKLELRISLKGFNTSQYTVYLEFFGNERLRAVLSPAT